MIISAIFLAQLGQNLIISCIMGFFFFRFRVGVKKKLTGDFQCFFIFLFFLISPEQTVILVK